MFHDSDMKSSCLLNSIQAMLPSLPRRFSANGRKYKIPSQPTVVVCIDGCDPDYLEQAEWAGFMPWYSRLKEQGLVLRAYGAMPSYTNPNNVSIVTGVPPSVHGISGNYFLDPITGSEVMMNDPEFLRCTTLLAEASRAGVRVAAITAKEKLRRLLGSGWQGICLSAEQPELANMDVCGTSDILRQIGPPPLSVYSAELSEYVLAAGIKLIENHLADLVYLSTTDYIQHKHAPGTPTANSFYGMLDRHLAQLESLGCVVAVTADHGMNGKSNDMGKPNVLYLQDWLLQYPGNEGSRVILPITDPYVVHHAALGSYACVYLQDPARVNSLCIALLKTPGVEIALPRVLAAEALELPPDRIGDIVVVADRHTVFGTRVAAHDLTNLEYPLRSHGCRWEQQVPLVVNRTLQGIEAKRRLRNFDVFDLALNYAQ